MTLSVLVPIYNVAEYLDQCLASLHEQTLKDMEVLCLNDGSTDDSGAIIDKYVALDSRFRKIDKTNTGYGNTMNVGLSEAKGEYIGIVESDDFIQKDMMEELLKCAKEFDVDVVKSQYYLYSGIKNSSEYFDNFRELKVDTVINPAENPRVFLVLQSVWSSLYKTSFLKENKISFHETPGASFQDVSFAFQVFANAKRVYLMNRAYYHYRISNPNSSVKMINKLEKLRGELVFIEDYISNRGDEKQLLPISTRLAYRILLENYYDAFPGYQFVLVNELEERLKTAMARGDFEAEIWDSEAVNNAVRIIEDKDKFYQETGKKIFDARLWQGTINAKIYAEGIINELRKYNRIILYGAGRAGTKIKDGLLRIGFNKEKLVFAVTELENNQEIDGIPVIGIHNLEPSFEEVILISVAEKNQYAIKEVLGELGFENVLYLSDEVRKELYQDK